LLLAASLAVVAVLLLPVLYDHPWTDDFRLANHRRQERLLKHFCRSLEPA